MRLQPVRFFDGNDKAHDRAEKGRAEERACCAEASVHCVGAATCQVIFGCPMCPTGVYASPGDSKEHSVE